MKRVSETLAEMKSKHVSHNLFTYNILLNVMAKNGDLKQMLEYFDDMKLKGIKPDSISYTTVISAAGMGKVWEFAKFQLLGAILRWE
jgi:pentatricopeptide repeat protein